jgi:hypothetical protein
LHADLEHAGQSDLESIPLVLPRWMGEPNRIPYTFTPAKVPKVLSLHLSLSLSLSS